MTAPVYMVEVVVDGATLDGVKVLRSETAGLGHVVLGWGHGRGGMVSFSHQDQGLAELEQFFRRLADLIAEAAG